MKLHIMHDKPALVDQGKLIVSVFVYLGTKHGRTYA